MALIEDELKIPKVKDLLDLRLTLPRAKRSLQLRFIKTGSFYKLIAGFAILKNCSKVMADNKLT